MYALGKEYLLVIKEKINIESIIYAQERFTLLMISLLMSNICIRKKRLMTGNIQKMTGQKLRMLSLLI